MFGENLSLHVSALYMTSQYVLLYFTFCRNVPLTTFKITHCSNVQLREPVTLNTFKMCAV